MNVVPRFTNEFSDSAFNPLSASIRDNFGLGVHPQDLLTPYTLLPRVLQQRSLVPSGYDRPWALLPKPRASPNDEKTVENISKAKDGTFQVCVDVQHFAPKEISVKAVDHTIVVEAQHEEQPDDQGYIERHFIRKYVLPKDYKSEDIHTTLSSDGILTVRVPLPSNVEGKRRRKIPIHRTGPACLNI
jgi:crystallin, alpha B